MPRPLRIHAPGLLYHTICRGNQKQQIFFDEQDFRAYLHRLVETHETIPFRLYAYALMKNHVHLMVEANTAPISKVMQLLQQRYTQHFNSKYDKVGHLFQGRFKSIVCQRDEYLLELVRYIHLNPVRAGIVKDPADYPWTSHRSYMVKKADAWLDRDAILAQFGKRRDQAQKAYLDFVMTAIKTGHRDDLYTLKDQQVLGDDEFFKSLPIGDGVVKKTPRHQDIEEIEGIVSKAMGIDKGEFYGPWKGKLQSVGRAFVAILAIERGHQLKNIAVRYQRDISTMCHAIDKARKLVKADVSAARILKKVETSLA